MDIDKKLLEKFKLFTEGVIFLMKRKYKEALENFNEVSKAFTVGKLSINNFQVPQNNEIQL